MVEQERLKKEEKREQFRKILEAKHDAVLKNLLADSGFRFYMSELLGYCKTFENAFNEKGNVAAFQNGMQSVGQKIFEDIMLSNPEAFLKMRQEEEDLLSLRDKPEEMARQEKIGE